MRSGICCNFGLMPNYRVKKGQCKKSVVKIIQLRAKGSVVLLSPSDASAEGGVAVVSNKRNPRRGDCVKYCIGEHHTLAPTRGSHCVFSFAPPSADASDGDSDTTEPSALRVCILKMFLFVSIFNISTGFCSRPAKCPPYLMRQSIAELQQQQKSPGG